MIIISVMNDVWMPGGYLPVTPARYYQWIPFGMPHMRLTKTTAAAANDRPHSPSTIQPAQILD